MKIHFFIVVVGKFSSSAGDWTWVCTEQTVGDHKECYKEWEGAPNQKIIRHPFQKVFFQETKIGIKSWILYY